MAQKRIINISYEAECTRCNGTGNNSIFERCKVCEGRGYVLITKQVHITVEPSPERPVKFTEVDFNNL